eukprot:COSAG02_NODE_9071_length_2342_cov_2.438252_2_plen_326_part_01
MVLLHLARTGHQVVQVKGPRKEGEHLEFTIHVPTTRRGRPKKGASVEARFSPSRRYFVNPTVALLCEDMLKHTLTKVIEFIRAARHSRRRRRDSSGQTTTPPPAASLITALPYTTATTLDWHGEETSDSGDDSLSSCFATTPTSFADIVSNDELDAVSGFDAYVDYDGDSMGAVESGGSIVDTDTFAVLAGANSEWLQTTDLWTKPLPDIRKQPFSSCDADINGCISDYDGASSAKCDLQPCAVVDFALLAAPFSGATVVTTTSAADGSNATDASLGSGLLRGVAKSDTGTKRKSAPESLSAVHTIDFAETDGSTMQGRSLECPKQ